MLKVIIALAEARAAAGRGDHEEALRVLADPSVREHRKIRELRVEVLRQLECAAGAALAERRFAAAGVLIDRLAALGGDPSCVAGLRERLSRAAADCAAREAEAGGALAEARRRVAEGDLAGALRRLQDVSPEDGAAMTLRRTVERRLAEAEALAVEALRRLAKGDPDAGRLAEQAIEAYPRGDGANRIRDALAVRRLREAEARGPAELAEMLRRLSRGATEEGSGGDLAGALDAAAKSLVREADRALAAGGMAEAIEWLGAVKAGGRLHAEGMARRENLVRLERALLLAETGGAGSETVEEALRALPRSEGLTARVAALRSSARAAAEALARVESRLLGGDPVAAREALLRVLEALPSHRGARALLRSVNEDLARDAGSLREIRRQIDAGDAEAARAEILRLRARRRDLAELEGLRGEVEELERRQRERTLAASPPPGMGRGTTLPPVGGAPEPGRSASGPAFARPDPDVRDSRTASSPGEALNAGGAPGDRAPGPRTVLRIDELGEWILIEGDSVVFGHARSRDADLPILASLGSRHAEIRREPDLHAGARYAIVALEGRPLTVNHRSVASAALGDGDIVGLGDDLALRFTLPCARSRSAVLEILGSFEIDGVRRIVLWAGGRSGAFVFGPSAGRHAVADGAPADVEIYREVAGVNAGQVVVRSAAGVSLPGGPERALVPLPAGRPATVAGRTFVVEDLRLR